MIITLTSIPVENPLTAFKFYTETLGFLEKLYLPDMNLAIVVSPEQPDGTALLLEPNDNPLSKTWQQGVYQAGLPLIIFGVEDIQREYERLTKLGIVFRGEPVKTEWGTKVIFEDTCGNLVQLHQF